MSESVTFWLDNKRSAGTTVARLGTQILVNYRDRYYVIENNAALTKGGRPLRYSRSSLPTIWKKALKGDLSPGDLPADGPDVPVKPAPSRKPRQKKDDEVPAVTEQVSAPTPPISITEKPAHGSQRAAKAAKKASGKPAPQSAVSAECPYCNLKHDIPLEKGRSGKPFFHACSKCKNDFAVRFVQVTMYQAQVAGFN